MLHIGDRQDVVEHDIETVSVDKRYPIEWQIVTLSASRRWLLKA